MKKIMCIVALILAISFLAYFYGSKFTKISLDSNPAIGSIDFPSGPFITDPHFIIHGWALDKDKVKNIRVIFGKRELIAEYGRERKDVAHVHPEYPNSIHSGFVFSSTDIAPPLMEKILSSRITEVKIVVEDKKGNRTEIASKTFILPNEKQFRDLQNSKTSMQDRFFIAFAASNISRPNNGALEIPDLYRPLESSTIKVGIRVPILYLRTTKGKDKDFVFDPEFDTSRLCTNSDRHVSSDNLSDLIAFSVKNKLPVLFTLNGGIWADAVCDVPEWDVNDFLEKDIQNVQWSEKNEIVADDFLSNLPGSMASPELARSLTLNIYADDVRKYKKRNLQQAAKIIKNFSEEHPELYIGINLDPDVYLNPFFSGDVKQWFDYNPATLRQFQEWLSHTGQYAPGKSLSRYLSHEKLSLEEVNTISGKSFASWSEVDPPRKFPVQPIPFWEDRWHQYWTDFKRHLVDLHYDELSEWLAELDFDPDTIYSSQGFNTPRGHLFPFAININSTSKNYDEAGVSIEGSVPSKGKLGAIIYGPGAYNDIKTEDGGKFFSILRRYGAGWAAVEHNTSDHYSPSHLAPFDEGYRSMRDLFNYGARLVSPMAWNGNNGINVGKPDFVSYTSVRNTPLEYAIREFMMSHANLPFGSIYYGFGTFDYLSDDGWIAEIGELETIDGAIKLLPDSGAIEMTSPTDIRAYLHEMEYVLLGLDKNTKQPKSVQILAKYYQQNSFEKIVEYQPKNEDIANKTIKIMLPENLKAVPVEQLKIRVQTNSETTLDYIMLYPK